MSDHNGDAAEGIAMSISELPALPEDRPSFISTFARRIWSAPLIGSAAGLVLGVAIFGLYNGASAIVVSALSASVAAFALGVTRDSAMRALRTALRKEYSELNVKFVADRTTATERTALARRADEVRTELDRAR